MSEDTHGAHVRGLFDRATKGSSVGPDTVRIERGRIMFFADVLQIDDPIHSDIESARSAGHPDLVAPPSFFMAIEADVNQQRARRGDRSAMETVGCDLRYLLHGDESYEYVQPIFAGDDVRLTTEIVDFYDKKGGALEFVTLNSRVEHTQRGLLLRARRTLLHRLG